MEHFRYPRNVGVFPEEDENVVISEIGNPSCGDVMKLFLKIEKNVIIDAKFKTFGCACAIACSSMTTELAKGKTIEDAEKITNKDIADALDGIPPRKMHCSNLGAEALHAAISKYRKKKKQESRKKSRLTNLLKKISENEYKIDLRGKQCPMTFVYTKIAIEEMKEGQILEVVLDFKKAYTNVPNSVKEQNLGDIIKEHEENGIKTIWIRKK